MEGPRTWPSRKLKASAAPTTRRSASAYDVPFVPTLRQNIKRFATAGRQGQAAKEGSAAVDRTFHTNYQPVRQQMQESKSKMEKAARTQALIDFSHLPKSDLLRLAAPQRKVLGHGKTAPANAHRGGNVSFVKSAAQASAARRGRQLGVVKHKKNPSVPVSLPRLENRFYQVSISVDDDKVYATPIPPKPPPPPPPSKKTSRTSDQSPASSPGTSRRPGQLSALRPRGKSAIFGGPRGAQERKKKRKRALSGRERRQQRSTAAIEIQRVARGRAARLRVNTMKELRVYAQSLTRKAQEYEAEHGFDNWQFWMHEMSSTDDDEESEEESEDGNAGGAIDEIERERRRLAKRRQRFEKRLRDEMKGILHWKPWH